MTLLDPVLPPTSNIPMVQEGRNEGTTHTRLIEYHNYISETKDFHLKCDLRHAGPTTTGCHTGTTANNVAREHPNSAKKV